jgi:uncharacterized protein (DUF1697 family)
MQPTHLALLRGINVGGKNQIRMAQLTLILEGLGLTAVKTYIQSGNVVFHAPAKLRKDLASRISKAIEATLGLKVPVIVLTREELNEAVAGNPYPEAAATHKLLHILFLADPPTREQLATLDYDRSPPDRYQIAGRYLYAHLPNGVANSKLTNAYFDSKLKTISTGRNWQTVTTLQAMML